MLRGLLYSLLLTCFTCGAFAQCNGYPELCSKRFDEVAHAFTHNSFNAVAEGFSLANQTFGIARQLEDGVRGLMIDVYEDDGEIVVYHGFNLLGSEPLANNLADIKNFLDNNPNEIVSIIFESYVSSSDIENELTAAGLFSCLHHHTPGTPWATLQEMINAEERLVIFSQSNDGLPEQTWYHYAWAHVFDTDYSFNNPSEFDCSVNRGSTDNDLYLINHWITSGVGTGDSTQAAIVNINPLLMDRVQQCQSETERFPNFIGVDFYHIGDVMEVVNMLNEVESTPVNEIGTNTLTKVFPNPASEHIWITSEHPHAYGVVFRNVLGEQMNKQILNNGEASINAANWDKGIYFYSLIDKNGVTLEVNSVSIH